MKILAAITDVVFVKKYRYGYIITKIKKYLVYDPKVTRWDFGKKVKDD
jgi:hypothetical protein